MIANLINYAYSYSEIDKNTPVVSHWSRYWYVNNHEVNWRIQAQKYRKGLMKKCNFGVDREIKEYDPYDLSDSDFDSDEDWGYKEGKRTKYAGNQKGFWAKWFKGASRGSYEVL